jgi:hypothetical protein
MRIISKGDKTMYARIVIIDELYENGASFAYADEVYSYYYLHISGELVMIGSEEIEDLDR